ncbi:MAG: acyl-CoA thioesterase, partial [bacterium]
MTAEQPSAESPSVESSNAESSNAESESPSVEQPSADSPSAESDLPRREDFPHLRQLAVRWADFDMLRHLNNVQYYRFIECVVVDYLTAIGTDWSDDRVVPFAVESGCRFLRPIALT